MSGYGKNEYATSAKARQKAKKRREKEAKLEQARALKKAQPKVGPRPVSNVAARPARPNAARRRDAEAGRQREAELEAARQREAEAARRKREAQAALEKVLLKRAEKNKCEEKLEPLRKKLKQLRKQITEADQSESVELKRRVNEVEGKLQTELKRSEKLEQQLQQATKDLTSQVQDQQNKIKEQQEVIDQQKEDNTELTRDKQKLEKERIALKAKLQETTLDDDEGFQTPDEKDDDLANIEPDTNIVTDNEIKMASSWYDSKLKVELSNYLTNSGKAKLDALQTSLLYETELGDPNTTIIAKDIMPEGIANIRNQEAKLKNARAILYALAKSAQNNRLEITDKTYQKKLQEAWGDENDSTDLLDDSRPELGTGFQDKGIRKNHLQAAISYINAIFKKRTRSQLEEVFVRKKFKDALINEPMDDLHPFVMKPAAPQLHMQKLHMQTSMEKLDLEPAMETVPDDVHVQAVQPMKCGKDMKVEPVACAKHETEHAHGDMKCKHEPAEADILTEIEGGMKALGRMFGGKKKKKKKTKGKKLIADPQQCDSCGDLHDGDHDCEVEAFQAMLDGYDSEGQALEKPRCASVGLANRKLNELQ